MSLSSGVSAAIQRVLIFGVNCNSTSIIKNLSPAGFDVHVTTSVDELPRKESFAVAVHRCDLSNESVAELLLRLRPDVVVSTVAGGSYETQKRLIDCAINSGVQRFIPCEFGQDSLNKKIQERLRPNGEKAKIIVYLEEQAVQYEFSWVGLAVGTILDRGLLNGNLGFDLKWQSATLHGEGNETFAASSAMWVGRVVLTAIQQWEDVRNRYVYVAGLTTSANLVVETLQRATDQQWTRGRAEVAECVQEAERRIERGFPDAGMFLMERSLLYDEDLDAVTRFLEKDAKVELGLEGERFYPPGDTRSSSSRRQHGLWLWLASRTC